MVEGTRVKENEVEPWKNIIESSRVKL